jgi:hypothetical protein
MQDLLFSKNGNGDESEQKKNRKRWAKEEGAQMHRELHSLNVGEFFLSSGVGRGMTR